MNPDAAGNFFFDFLTVIGAALAAGAKAGKKKQKNGREDKKFLTWQQTGVADGHGTLFPSPHVSVHCHLCCKKHCSFFFFFFFFVPCSWQDISTIRLSRHDRVLNLSCTRSVFMQRSRTKGSGRLSEGEKDRSMGK